jgi:hypothetical protein
MDAVAHELLTERILFSMASNTRVTDACTVNKSVRTSKSGDSGSWNASGKRILSRNFTVGKSSIASDDFTSPTLRERLVQLVDTKRC